MKKIIAITILFTTLGLWSCNNCEEGNGIRAEKKVKVEAETVNYEIEISAEINLIQGSYNQIEINTDSNFLSMIEIKQNGNTMEISSAQCLEFENNITINITSTDFEEITIEGISKLSTINQIKTEEMEINASGSATIYLDVLTEKLEIYTSGSSETKIMGSTERLDLDLEGSSVFTGDKLNSKKAYVEISGSSNASVRCSKYLDADLSGSSSLKYFGNPDKVNTDVSGSARISSK